MSISAFNFKGNLRQAVEISNKQSCVIELQGSCLIVGDIHGDYQSLLHAKSLSDEYSLKSIIFLGDYVDRGTGQIQVLNELFTSLTTNSNIIFLRGNHEDPSVYHRYNFFQVLSDNGFMDLDNEISDFFATLPIMAKIKNEALLVHGGIPFFEKPFGVETLRKPLPKVVKTTKELGILWNDPIESQESPVMQNEYFSNNWRGPNISAYTQDAVKTFCEFNNTKILIRAHIALRSGYKKYNERVHSMFSSASGSYHGFNPKYLVFHSSEDFQVIS